MIDISKINSGDLLFVRVRFVWYKPRTYLSRLINFGINFWNGLQGKPYCPCNHVAIFCWNDRGLWVFESDENGFVRKSASEYMRGLTPDNYWIKRYDIGQYNVLGVLLKLEGVKYAYENLFKEVANQLFNEKIDMYGNKAGERMVCSQVVATAINRLNSTLCVEPMNQDPQDLYFDNKSKFINLELN